MSAPDTATSRLRSDSRWRTYSLAGALLALLVAAAAAAVVMSGGSSGTGNVTASATRRAQAAAASHRATGSVAVARARTPSSATASAHVAAGSGGAAAHPAATTTHAAGSTPGATAHLVAEQPDPEAAYSAPAPPSVHHAPAQSPATAGAMVAPGAPSDAQVRQELNAMNAALAAEHSSTQASSGAIGGDGTVQAPPGVPAVIARVIAGANAITDFPYVYGGGHASFVDSAYDCSGSVSYALAAAGLLSAPETSGQLESWGAPGPGRWLTIYANAGHVYMFVDGLRYDTAGRTGVFSTRWQTGPDPVGGPNNSGFVARHYPGL